MHPYMLLYAFVILVSSVTVLHVVAWSDKRSTHIQVLAEQCRAFCSILNAGYTGGIVCC